MFSVALAYRSSQYQLVMMSHLSHAPDYMLQQIHHMYDKIL
jgi:hypothetical protein